MTCRFPVLSRLPTGTYFFASCSSVHLRRRALLQPLHTSQHRPPIAWVGKVPTKKSIPLENRAQTTSPQSLHIPTYLPTNLTKSPLPTFPSRDPNLYPTLVYTKQKRILTGFSNFPIFAKLQRRWEIEIEIEKKF